MGKKISSVINFLFPSDFWKLLAIYLISILIFYLFFFYYKSDTMPLLRATLNSKPEEDNSFFISLSASFLEDFIFFIIIGLFIFIKSKNKLEDNPIESRIRALANSKNADPKLASYLLDTIPSYLIYTNKLTIKLTILEYNEEHNAIRYEVEREAYIRNMDRTEYSKQDFKVNVIPGLGVNNYFGTISHFSVKNNVTNPIVKVDADNDDEVRIKETGNNEVILGYVIPENGEVIYKTKLIMWNKVFDLNADSESDEDFWIFNQFIRFTKECTYTIKNNTDYDFDIHYRTSKNLKSNKDEVKKDFIVKNNRNRTIPEIATFYPYNSLDIRVLKPIINIIK